MNLLILVTALFAIVAYFMMGLTDVVVGQSAQQIANSKSEQALEIINSDKLCFSSPVNIPSSIKYFGDSKEFYYTMKISRTPVKSVPGKPNTLIFSIANRKTPEKIIAASSVNIDAEIVLFSWKADFETGTTEEFLQKEDSVFIDPHAAEPVTSFMLVKEVYNGKKYLYIIACSFRANYCYANMQDVRVKIKHGCVANVPAHDSTCLCIPNSAADEIWNYTAGTTQDCPPADKCFRNPASSCCGNS